MKPVFQTIFDNRTGNCLQACVASIFELGLEDVPNFVGAGEGWVEAYCGFLFEQYRLQVMTLDRDALLRQGVWWPGGYHIISGDSPRGDWQHSVVGFEGEMVHDPHPEGGGLAEERTFDVFVARGSMQGRRMAEHLLALSGECEVCGAKRGWQCKPGCISQGAS